MKRILLAAGLLACASCVAGRPVAPAKLDTTKMVWSTYEAVDQLLWQHRELPGFDKDSARDIDRVLVATAVDVNDVQATSEFGRVLTEFIQSRLTHHNYDVIHATIRQDHLLIHQDGQFLLSRDKRNLATDYNARTALVTTYSVVPSSVIVSMKLVSTVEDSVLASQELILPQSEDIAQLLSGHSTRVVAR